MGTKVVMLTGSRCAECTKLKNRLNSGGLVGKYEELSVETEEGLSMAKSLGVRSIPVLVEMNEGLVVQTITGSSYEISKYKELFN
jgi:glutaredoxin